MKKFSLIFLSITLFLLSCANNEKTYKKYKKFHARSHSSLSSHKKEEAVGKRKRHASPIESMALGRDKKAKVQYKESRLSSIKSQNSTQINENRDLQPFDLHGDFDNILQNGRYVGSYKIGNPYKIEGVPYYPQEYDDYEEVGVASWYGEQFHGRLTANGEIYDLDSMTAAHQTLPLPSIVKVTNLENGKSVMVRVNDRGPFAKNRIIDLSKKAADKLAYRDKGTTTVKVEYMPEETEELLHNLGLK